jgi:hypothetical protein
MWLYEYSLDSKAFILLLTIPDELPNAEDVRAGKWPFSDDRKYDIVVCDGGVVHTMVADRNIRINGAQRRLFHAQLSIALQRVQPGGTIVVQLHQSRKWGNFALVRQISEFAHVQLFKLLKGQVLKSAFYMVAKQVQTHTEAAGLVLDECRRGWRMGIEEGLLATPSLGEGEEVSKQDVARLLREFGPT